MDKILDDASASTDPEKRKSLFWQAMQIIHDDVAYVNAWQQEHLFGVSNRFDWEPWIDNMYYFHGVSVQS